MNWLTHIWSMCGAACLTIASLHLLIALLGHQRRINILVGVMALGAATVTFQELGILHSESIESVRAGLHRVHFFLLLLLVPIPWFIQASFGTGRRWLAWTATGLWMLAFALSLTQTNSLTFSEIKGLQTQFTFWGEPYSQVDGVRNPLAWIADLGVLAILLHTIDASISLWRLGSRRRALLSGGSIILFFLIALAHVPLVDMGILRVPTFIGPSFMLVVVAVSVEIVYQVASTSKLSLRLAANETRWQSLLSQVNLMVVGVDLEGRIEFVNPHLEEVSGYSKDTLTGQPFQVLVPARDHHRIKELFIQAMAGSVTPREEIRLLSRSSEERIVEWTPVLLRDENEKISGMISVGADLTDRHRFEQALRASRTKLEQAGRLNMLGELTATLAHELNQPLAAILSNAQAARRFLQAESPDLDEIREIIDDIIRDDKRSSEVIQRLRSLIRPGKTKVSRLELHPLITDTLNLCLPEFESRQIDYKFEFDAVEPTVEAGRVELQQVLLNLVANAMHAMEQSETKVLIIQTKSVDGRHLIEVRDSGTGIREDLLPGIFDPLSTTRSEGLGMGLAICRRLLELHGGRIEAKNCVDSGAEFTISLPVV